MLVFPCMRVCLWSFVWHKIIVQWLHPSRRSPFLSISCPALSAHIAHTCNVPFIIYHCSGVFVYSPLFGAAQKIPFYIIAEQECRRISYVHTISSAWYGRIRWCSPVRSPSTRLFWHYLAIKMCRSILNCVRVIESDRKWTIVAKSIGTYVILLTGSRSQRASTPRTSPS